MKDKQKLFMLWGGDLTLSEFRMKYMLFSPRLLEKYTQIIKLGVFKTDVKSGFELPELKSLLRSTIETSDSYVNLVLFLHGGLESDGNYEFTTHSTAKTTLREDYNSKLSGLLQDDKAYNDIVENQSPFSSPECIEHGTSAEEFFKILVANTQNKPLKILALSCYAGFLLQYTKYLPAGSILITLSDLDPCHAVFREPSVNTILMDHVFRGGFSITKLASLFAYSQIVGQTIFKVGMVCQDGSIKTISAEEYLAKIFKPDLKLSITAGTVLRLNCITMNELYTKYKEVDSLSDLKTTEAEAKTALCFINYRLFEQAIPDLAKKCEDVVIRKKYEDQLKIVVSKLKPAFETVQLGLAKHYPKKFIDINDARYFVSKKLAYIIDEINRVQGAIKSFQDPNFATKLPHGDALSAQSKKELCSYALYIQDRYIAELETELLKHIDNETLLGYLIGAEKLIDSKKYDGMMSVYNMLKMVAVDHMINTGHIEAVLAGEELGPVED